MHICMYSHHTLTPNHQKYSPINKILDRKHYSDQKYVLHVTIYSRSMRLTTDINLRHLKFPILNIVFGCCIHIYIYDRINAQK